MSEVFSIITLLGGGLLVGGTVKVILSGDRLSRR
jgi:hypothetical protein